MSPEFYYGEMLRWSFGFENPNKAAVVFASLVPLLWAAWLAVFSINPIGSRISAMLASGMGFLAIWGCLLLTFSRGGLVAALVGMAVVSVWRFVQLGEFRFSNLLRTLKMPIGWMSLCLFAAVVATAILLGVGSRSLDAMGDDASVSNRVELWSAALQMAYENPSGFGGGRSGSEFMQWYQGVDRSEGYRTMVNSYLTFLVERGWLPFALVILAFAAFWTWTWPVKNELNSRWRTALWASLIAFLVAGVFSTTMEEPLGWVAPALAVLGLIGLKFSSTPFHIPPHRIALTFGFAALLLVGLFTLGVAASQQDSIGRTFARNGEGYRVVASVWPKNALNTKIIRFFPDEAVLGPGWGKLIRILALQTGCQVWIIGTPDTKSGTVDSILVGNAAITATPEFADRTILIAPATGDLSLSAISIVLVPEIDEDGRASFWRERIENFAGETPTIITLDGVGNRVEWAWDQVVDVIKSP